MATILTQRQQLTLSLLFKEESIKKHFYLTGGTALSEYYLHHRYSEDLDFFSDEEIVPQSIQIILKKIQRKLGFSRIDYQQSYNRNLFFLHFADGGVLKTEFTFYPFTVIELAKDVDGIRIDSLLDIAVNKAFTIYQTPRGRDFIDLYLIIVKEKWNLSDLLKKSRIKFDTCIDPLQLAQQLLKVTELADNPRMIAAYSRKEMMHFWNDEILKLKGEALK
jgi:predicted nucleotidyltransferase component of viral defense system